MQSFRHILLGFLLVGAGSPQAVSSKTLTLVNPVGESIELEIATTEPFLDVLDQIQSYFQGETTVSLENQELEVPMTATESFFNDAKYDFTMSHAGVTVRSKKNNGRDYNESVSKSEKEDIAYIVNTLAYESYLSIAGSKSSLEKAGKRIEHIHTLRFLIVIFSDEQLKAGVHAIRDRGSWLWSTFSDGIIRGLKEESARNNVAQYTDNFSQKLKIDANLVAPYIQQGKWNELVDVLINKVPRDINSKRYDM